MKTPVGEIFISHENASQRPWHHTNKGQDNSCCLPTCGDGRFVGIFARLPVRFAMKQRRSLGRTVHSVRFVSELVRPIDSLGSSVRPVHVEELVNRETNRNVLIKARH